MRPQILAKLKDPRTDWKYVLIVVILATMVGGEIFWFKTEITKEITSLTQFPQVKRVEKERRKESRKVTSQETPSYQEFICQPEIFKLIEKFLEANPGLKTILSQPEIFKLIEKFLEANPGLKMEDFEWNVTSKYEISITPIEEFLKEFSLEISIPPFPPPKIGSSYWKFSPDNTKAVAMHFKIYKPENERVPVLLLYTSEGVSIVEDGRPFEGVEIEFFDVSWLNNKQLIHVFQGISYYEVLGGERKEKPVRSFLEIELIDLENRVIRVVGIASKEGGIFNNPWQK